MEQANNTSDNLMEKDIDGFTRFYKMVTNNNNHYDSIALDSLVLGGSAATYFCHITKGKSDLTKDESKDALKNEINKLFERHGVDSISQHKVITCLMLGAIVGTIVGVLADKKEKRPDSLVEKPSETSAIILDEKNKESRLDTFFKELEQLPEDELIAINNKPHFVTMACTPYDQGKWNEISLEHPEALADDCNFITFRKNGEGTRVAELKNLLKPIVSIRPDLLVAVGDKVKTLPLVRKPIQIKSGMSSGQLQSLREGRNVSVLLEDINKLGLSDVSIIDKIIQSRLPHTSGLKIYIVGNQLFEKRDFLRKYAYLQDKPLDQVHLLFELKETNRANYYTCLIPPSVLKEEFSTCQSEFKKIVDRHTKK